MTRRHQKTLTASYSVPAYERDVTLVANAADIVVTLPPAGAGTRGNRVTVVAQTISAVTGLSVSPAAADKVQGTTITAADNKDVINTAATDAVGDSLTVECDGVDGWWITNVIGTWAREA